MATRSPASARTALAALALILAASGAALAGCGSSGETTATGGPATATEGAGPSSETTSPKPPQTTSKSPGGVAVHSCRVSLVEGAVRATGVACGTAKATVAGWLQSEACAGAPGVSRGACSVGAYRCLSARTERGLAVNCALPGRSISFTVAEGESASAPGGVAAE